MDEKYCARCDQTLPIEQFRERKKRDKLTRQSYCIECNREYSRKWRAKNMDKIVERNAENRKRNKRFLYEYYQNNPCVDCGEADPVVLQFDHVSGEKRGNLATLAGDGYSLETLKEEISKCEVRCANCHTRKTALDLEWYSTYIE